MKKLTTIAVAVLIVVVMGLLLALYLQGGDTAGAVTSDLTIELYGAPASVHPGNLTVWTNTGGVWSYSSEASAGGNTTWMFKDLASRSNCYDQLMAAAAIAGFVGGNGRASDSAFSSSRSTAVGNNRPRDQRRREGVAVPGGQHICQPGPAINYAIADGSDVVWRYIDQPVQLMTMLFPYQDKDSRIHRLDARPKMVFVLAFFLLSILISDILNLALLLFFVIVVAAAGKVMRETLGLLKYTAYVALFLFLFSIIFAPAGDQVILDLGLFKVMEGSILFAVSMCLRLLLTVVAFAILTFTVHPDDLLRILSKFGFKSMTGMSIATRMYPTIAADSTAISDAMKARGVEFDDGNLIRKAKARAPVMMPLLMNSMERSMDIAEAMETRGFGAGKRTRYFDASMVTREKLMIASFLAAIPFGVIMFTLGSGNADYLAGQPFTVTAAGATVALIEILFFTPILLGGGR